MLGYRHLGAGYLGAAPYPFPTAKYLVCAPGSFALTGTAATLRHEWRLVCAPGSFLITGSPATFTYLTRTTIRVTIGGVDRTLNLRHGSLEVEDVLNDAPNRCTFGVRGLTPAEGQTVTVTRGPTSALEFAGNILTVQQVYEQIPANVAFHVTCQDYTWKLNRRLVTKRWTNVSASTIAADIISSFTTGFTATNVVGALATLPEFESVLEPPSQALARLAAEIAGNFYVDYAADLHFFLTETTSAPDDISDALLATTTARALTHAGDLSQVRTRVIGIGGGSASEANVAAGGALVPLKDITPFLGATMAIAGPNILTFSGTHAGGIASTVVGNTASPGGSVPSVSVAASVVGPLVGTYAYKIAFGNAYGETAAGSASGSVVASAFAAPGAGTVNVGSTIGRLIGAYSYQVTFVTALGQTTGGTTFSRTGVGTTTPGSPSVSVVSSTIGKLIGTYGYKVTTVSAFGESPASAAGSRTAVAQPAPSAPSSLSTGTAVGAVLGTYGWKVAFVGADGNETIGTALSGQAIPAATAAIASVSGTGGSLIDYRVSFFHPTLGETAWSSLSTVGSGNHTITVSNLPTGCGWKLYSTGSGGSGTGVFYHVTTVPPGVTSFTHGADTGPVAQSPAATLGKAVVFTIPTGPTGTLARRIYRTVAGGSDYFLAGEVGNNSTTTFTDLTPDTSLTYGAPLVNVNGEQHTVSSISTGPTGTTKRYLYRTEAGGSIYYFLRELPDNSTTSLTDNAPDAELDKGRPAPATATSGDQHALTGLPTGPTGTLARNLFRTEAGGTSYKFLYQLTDNTTTVYTDNTADADLGAFIPLINTAGGNKIALTGIPLGDATVTQRHIYRTEAGGSDYKFVDTLNDNTTTTFIDDIPDESLGRLALTVSTIGATSGDTALILADVTGFPSTGWVLVDSQMVSYTGISGTTLTGIPPTGSGALLTSVRGGVTVVTMPFLSGCAGILYPIDAGADVRLYLVRNDTAAQTALAALEGGDGIHEGTIDDRSIITIAGLTTGCDAELTGFKSKQRSITVTSRDVKLRSGKTLTLNLGPPTNQVGAFLIQRVVSRDYDTVPGAYPLRDVVAAPIRLSYRDVLRQQAKAVTP